MCLFNLVLSINASLHCSHWNGFTPLWIFLLCISKLVFLGNDLSHISHLYGLFPLCSRIWSRRLGSRANALPHILHEKGFSSECTNMWCFSAVVVESLAPHLSHFSFWFTAFFADKSKACNFMCFHIIDFKVNILSQSLHLSGLFNRCTDVCSSREFAPKNDRWH